MPSPDLFVKYRFTPEQKKATQQRAITTINFLCKVKNNDKESQKQAKLKLIQKKEGFYAVR